MLMEDQGPSPDGLGQEYWMAPQVPYAVRQRIETVFEVLSHLPLEQPVAVVSDAGKTIALNAPLLKIVGGASTDLLGRQWSSVMPGWSDRARGFRREGEQVFEEHLGRPDGEQVWVRVSLEPVAERGEPRAMAYLLFISKPDVETIDHDEVRRLRKSLQLLADTQTAFVVEVDRNGVMTFVSPSFRRAVGAAEKELVGHEFISRVRAADRADGAAERRAHERHHAVAVDLDDESGLRVGQQLQALAQAADLVVIDGLHVRLADEEQVGHRPGLAPLGDRPQGDAHPDLLAARAAEVLFEDLLALT